jgi:hypothetical protein
MVGNLKISKSQNHFLIAVSPVLSIADVAGIAVPTVLFCLTLALFTIWYESIVLSFVS